jgi:hypothetical protein
VHNGLARTGAWTGNESLSNAKRVSQANKRLSSTPVHATVVLATVRWSTMAEQAQRFVFPLLHQPPAEYMTTGMPAIFHRMLSFL